MMRQLIFVTHHLATVLSFARCMGGWQQELSNTQKNSLKEIPGFNELLIRLKYDVSDNW